MQPLRSLCAEHHLSQARHATHEHPSEVDKERQGAHKDGKACSNGNACNQSDVLNNSNVCNDSGTCNTSDACNSSVSSSSHVFIKRARGKLHMQSNVHERQHINMITCIATGATRVWPPHWDRGASHVHQAFVDCSVPQSNHNGLCRAL